VLSMWHQPSWYVTQMGVNLQRIYMHQFFLCLIGLDRKSHNKYKLMFIIVFCQCVFFHLPQRADTADFIKIISFSIYFIINH
jgi:hypothetical protein